MTIPQISGGTRLSDLPDHINDLADAVNGTGSNADYINVKAYGAVGDGVTDDTAAIQDALDAARAEGGLGVCYFPHGNYLISSTLSLEDIGSTKTGCKIIGAQGCDADPSPGTWVRSGVRIFGNFNGYLFSRTTTSAETGYYEFENLGLHNLHATGKCIQLNRIKVPSAVRNCSIRGYIGIRADTDTFNFRIQNCDIVGTNSTPDSGSRGIAIAGHTDIDSVDITSFDRGITGFSFSLNGARIENCAYGLYLGIQPDGTVNTWGGVIYGVSMEACDYGVYIRKGNGTLIGVGTNGTANSPSLGGISAFTTEERETGLSFINCGASGTWTTDFDLKNNATVNRTTLMNCYGTGTWTIGNFSNLEIINCLGVTEIRRLPVIATASLPAAATAQNGRAVIEDAGAGNRNLILYAGGERFRIDGGATF